MFSVGDRVRYVCENDSVPVGTEGLVLKVYAADLMVTVQFDGRDRAWGVTPAELELVKSAPSNKEDTNPKDALGLKKTQLDLVPAASLIYQALAMEDGAKKYGAYNWRTKKVKASIYLAAALRHLQSWQDGEECAEDSGKPHLAHALACLGILVDAKETGNLVDDRPTPGVAAALIKRLEKKS